MELELVDKNPVMGQEQGLLGIGSEPKQQKQGHRVQRGLRNPVRGNKISLYFTTVRTIFTIVFGQL